MGPTIKAIVYSCFVITTAKVSVITTTTYAFVAFITESLFKTETVVFDAEYVAIIIFEKSLRTISVQSFLMVDFRIAIVNQIFSENLEIIQLL